MIKGALWKNEQSLNDFLFVAFVAVDKVQKHLNIQIRDIQNTNVCMSLILCHANI